MGTQNHVGLQLKIYLPYIIVFIPPAHSVLFCSAGLEHEECNECTFRDLRQIVTLTLIVHSTSHAFFLFAFSIIHDITRLNYFTVYWDLMAGQHTKRNVFSVSYGWITKMIIIIFSINVEKVLKNQGLHNLLSRCSSGTGSLTTLSWWHCNCCWRKAWRKLKTSFSCIFRSSRVTAARRIFPTATGVRLFFSP